MKKIYEVRKGDRGSGKVQAFSIELEKIANSRKNLFAESLINEICEALKSNYRARDEAIKRIEPLNPYDDNFCEYVRGKIDALRGILEFIESEISNESPTS